MRLHRWSCSPRSAEGEQAEDLLLLQNLLQQMTGAEEVNVEGDEDEGEQVRQSARRRLKKLLKRCSWWSLKRRFLLRQRTLEMELLRWSAAPDGSAAGGGDGVTEKRCCCCSDLHLLLLLKKY